MINYIKSEKYRLLRILSLHITSVICLLLIAGAAAVLYFFHQTDPSFPYGNSKFYYANVIGSGALIIFVGYIFNSALTGKDTALIKQSVSFGVSRNTIFWSKFLLTLCYYLLVCAIGLGLVIILSETFLTSEDQLVRNFLIASVNMLPIVLSGFSVSHAMKMIIREEIYVILLLVLIFIFSGDLMRILFRPIAGLNELYLYAPDTLLNENLMAYLDNAAALGFEYWITGIVISGIALLFGARRFAKHDID